MDKHATFPQQSIDRALSGADFDYIRKIVRDRAAISLSDDKTYLVESRLAPLAKQMGHPSLKAFIQTLRMAPSTTLNQKIVEAMVTTETLFFRDDHPFVALQTKVLPQLIQQKQTAQCLNIWCAGCSSGQEPYSIAILLKEHFPVLNTWTINLLASDISNTILSRARAGRYSQHEMERGMPPALLNKYFCPLPKTAGKIWELRDEIRQKVDFRQFSLTDAWPYFPTMDIILLRNVLIYFETTTKQSILANIRKQLQPNGYLLLGAGETTINLDMAFEPIQINRAMYYRLRPGEMEGF